MLKRELENDLNKINYKNTIIFSLLLLIWFFLLLLGVFYFLFDSDKIIVFDNIGGLMNISTSLTGVATVYLLSKAILYQKTEIITLQEEMKNQTKAIEKEEITNRTVKFIDEWVEIFSTGSHHNFTDNQKKYLDRIILLKESEYFIIDFNFLIDFMKKDGLEFVLNKKLSNISEKIKVNKNRINSKRELLSIEKSISSEKYSLKEESGDKSTPKQVLEMMIEDKKNSLVYEENEINRYLIFLNKNI